MGLAPGDDRSKNSGRCGRRLPAWLNADSHFNVLVELVEHRHEPINSEAGKLGLPDA
jgi:hypothetical protein